MLSRSGSHGKKCSIFIQDWLFLSCSEMESQERDQETESKASVREFTRWEFQFHQHQFFLAYPWERFRRYCSQLINMSPKFPWQSPWTHEIDFSDASPWQFQSERRMWLIHCVSHVWLSSCHEQARWELSWREMKRWEQWRPRRLCSWRWVYTSPSSLSSPWSLSRYRLPLFSETDPMDQLWGLMLKKLDIHRQLLEHKSFWFQSDRFWEACWVQDVVCTPRRWRRKKEKTKKNIIK